MYKLQKCRRLFRVYQATRANERTIRLQSILLSTSLLQSVNCASSRWMSTSSTQNEEMKSNGVNSSVTDVNNNESNNSNEDTKDNEVKEVIDLLSKIDLNAPRPFLSTIDATLIPSKAAVTTEHLTANSSEGKRGVNNSFPSNDNKGTEDNVNANDESETPTAAAVDVNVDEQDNVNVNDCQINTNEERARHFSRSEYTPHEVRILLLSFLPPFAQHTSGMEVNEVMKLLPPELQKQLNSYNGGIVKFVKDYYPDDVIVQGNCRLHRKINVKEEYVLPSNIRENNVNGQCNTNNNNDSIDKSNDDVIANKVAVDINSNKNVNGKIKSKTKIDHKVLTKPPPPPSPGRTLHSTSDTSTSMLTGTKGEEQGSINSSSETLGNNGVASEVTNKGELSEFAKQYALGARTNLRGQKMIIDTLVEFIPTFYVNVDAVTALLPSWVHELYAETNFNFFIRRFKSYFDTRVQFGTSEIRLRPDFDHPKRGQADVKHAASLNMGDAIKHLGNLRRPAANTEASLISIIAPRMPREFTALPEVLQDISDIVARHPAFDPRLGVTGLLEKYPEYFQIVDGKLRARPYKSAPNSVADLDRSSSPLPLIFAKLMSALDAAAEGKNYSQEREKMMAMVPTGKLYALLSPEERTSVKTQCRSFPRFLRMHGKEIVVTVDNMRVYKFIPEHEVCTDTILDQRLRMNSISPDDPLLKIPAEMDDSTNADWAIKALYDALPLMQCVELHEVLSLVPPAVRDALPHDIHEVRTLLDTYPDYFTTWPYVDNTDIIVVQRAKVEVPTFQPAEIIRLVLPLIPQGGTEIELLFRRVPLPLQRYLYKYGMKTILKSLPEYFAVSGDRVIRVKESTDTAKQNL